MSHFCVGKGALKVELLLICLKKSEEKIGWTQQGLGWVRNPCWALYTDVTCQTQASNDTQCTFQISCQIMEKNLSVPLAVLSPVEESCTCCRCRGGRCGRAHATPPNHDCCLLCPLNGCYFTFVAAVTCNVLRRLTVLGRQPVSL